MPKAPISGLFGSSPFKPLQEHMASVQECTARLLPYFDAVLNKDWDEAVARRDLLELLTMQDKVANKAKDIAGLILGRKMEFPESIGPQLREFVTMKSSMIPTACRFTSVAVLPQWKKSCRQSTLCSSTRLLTGSAISVTARSRSAADLNYCWPSRGLHGT
jgi:hypothetical protein